jgi:hypothetical protein
MKMRKNEMEKKIKFENIRHTGEMTEERKKKHE